MMEKNAGRSIRLMPSGIRLSLKAKLTLAIACVLLFSVGLTSVLNYLNFEKRLTQTTDSSYQVVLDETQQDIQQAMSIGLPLSSISNVQDLITRRAALVEGIAQLSVVSNSGQTLYSFGVHSPADRKLSVSLSNSFNLEEGRLNLYYSTQNLEALQHTIARNLLLTSVSWVLFSAVIGYVFLRWILNTLLHRVELADKAFDNASLSDESKLISIQRDVLGSADKGTSARYVPLLTIALAISMTLFANVGSSYQSLSQFSGLYQERLEQKSNLIADTLSTMIDRLLANGVPLDKLVGLEEEFAHYISAHPELVTIALNQENDQLYQYPPNEDRVDFSVSQPLSARSDAKVTLELATDPNLIIKLIKDNAMDMLTVLIASCLVVTEIILFLCSTMIRMPWLQIKQLLITAQRDIVHHLGRLNANDELGRLTARLNQLVVKLNPEFEKKYQSQIDYRFIRLPLFMLVFAEATSLSFFPNYVATLPTTLSWLPENVTTSLPISLFMLCWALSLPFAGYWSDKVGRRLSLMVGGLVTACGLALTAAAISLEMLLITRALTAVGYGIVFISAQGFITDTTSDKERTRGMATFLSAFFSGSLCGAAIGGIVAEKLGFGATFLSAAMLSIFSVIIVYVFFEGRGCNRQSKPVRLQDFKLLLSNKYFMVITLFSAIPAKVVLTGFLYYICPVYLQYLGESSSVSGRVMMGYGLAIILISPLSAILVERWNSKFGFILFGGLLSGAALINILFLPGTFGLLAIVILVGIAHGICVAPQIPLLIELITDEGIDRGKVIGIFRLTERVGNVAGPMLAGLALSFYAFETTIMLFGITLFISSAILCLSYLFFIRRDKHKWEVSP